VALSEEDGRRDCTAVAHITGGGITGQRGAPRAARTLRRGDPPRRSFETPEIFFEIQRRGQVSADEMVRVFNCGLGMVVVVDRQTPDRYRGRRWRAPQGLGAVSVIGKVRSGSGLGGLDVSDERERVLATPS
jgi:phosphoribosylaminoimidazole (AIR) synthetase